MKPRLKGKVLTCTYTGTKWEEAIKQASIQCGVLNEQGVTVICFPIHSKLINRLKVRRKGNGKGGRIFNDYK